MSDQRFTLELVTSKVRLPKLTITKGRTLAEVTPTLSPATRSVLGAGMRGAGKAVVTQLAGILFATALTAATSEVTKRAATATAKTGSRQAA